MGRPCLWPMMMMTTDNHTTTVNLPILDPEQSAPLPSPAPHSHSPNMSPLTAILSLLVLIAIPALIYAFFFAIHCPRIPLRRPRQRRQAVDSNKDSKDIELVSGGVTKYKKEADHEEEQEHSSECPVCLSGFVEGDLLRQLSGCKHSFHVACIDKWLCSHSNCPVCRASVPTLTPTGRPKRPAQRAEEDFRQGLPDAASLV